LVAGSAAVLLQAGLRGDGGADTTSASDMRTLKALLLNGAIKPGDWTNSTTSPLDARYGAGVLNVFNSYKLLAGGKHPWIEQTSVNPGSAHPPGSSSGNIPAYSGWDYNSISSSTRPAGGADGINHYYFDVTNQFGAGPFTATATLVWNRPYDPNTYSGINDLNLFLYEVATETLIAESVSPVDNVEHFRIPALPPGRYDLQVLKRGGSGSQYVTDTEDYALAWEFFNVPLDIQATNGTATLTWPLYPDGFALQKAASLVSPNWEPETNSPSVINGATRVELPIDSANDFCRLKQQP